MERAIQESPLVGNLIKSLLRQRVKAREIAKLAMFSGGINKQFNDGFIAGLQLANVDLSKIFYVHVANRCFYFNRFEADVIESLRKIRIPDEKKPNPKKVLVKMLSNRIIRIVKEGHHRAEQTKGKSWATDPPRWGHLNIINAEIVREIFEYGIKYNLTNEVPNKILNTLKDPNIDQSVIDEVWNLCKMSFLVDM